MKFEIIEEYITQFPIYQYALLDSSQLEFFGQGKNHLQTGMSPVR